MKVVSTEALTKLIQLIKGSFISNTDTETTSEVTLATVATSGSYNDLSDKPTIPTVDQTYDGTSTNAQSGVAVASAISTMLSTLYPVGSIYIGTQSTCPLATLISGSQWQLVAQDRALWGGNGSNANTTIAAGLPNITGRIGGLSYDSNDAKNGMNGAFSWGNHEVRGAGDGAGDRYGYFDASRSSSIYGKSSTVQPPAYRVNLWRRTA